MIERAIVQSDGASRGNPGPAAIGGVVMTHDGEVLAEVSDAIGVTTSNVAEYRALIATLLAARELGVKSVDVLLDSDLIVQQVKGRYKVKKPHLKPLLAEVKQRLSDFEQYTINHVPRHRNRHADALANQALDARRV